jgi:beta-glucosidase
LLRLSRHAAVACLAVALLSCAGHAFAQAGGQNGSRAEALLRKMTLDEKIGQLVQRAGGRSKALNSRLDDTEFERVRAGQVGSYLHVAGAAPLARLQKVAVEESRLGVPLLFAMDVVHGYRTIFPVPLALAATWAPEVQERAARVAAEEATASGLHWTFAPMIDIARDARWGRIVEGAGEDPYLGARMAVAAVNGFQGGNVLRPGSLMATAKHFGAYGAAIGGRDYNTADLSERSLQEVYLPAFYAAARAGSGSFMVAFNDIAGVPTTANRELLRGVLRERWGWQGLMVSDWGSIGELLNHGIAANRGEAGVLSLDASVDMDMVGGVYADNLKDAIARDPPRLKLLDEAVLRILRVKEQLGLFDKPMLYHDTEREARELLSPEHREAARIAARQSLVLLKNDGHVLPLKLEDARPRTLAVIGALASDGLSALGSWRAQGKAEDVVTMLAGIQAAVPGNVKVTYAPGADPRKPDDVSGYDDAVKAVAAADTVVLVIGEDFDQSGESRSRSDLELPANQLELARRVLAAAAPVPARKGKAAAPAKTVIVVLANGRPLAMQWLNDNVPAILESWMPGVEGGHATTCPPSSKAGCRAWKAVMPWRTSSSASTRPRAGCPPRFRGSRARCLATTPRIPRAAPPIRTWRRTPCVTTTCPSLLSMPSGTGFRTRNSDTAISRRAPRPSLRASASTFPSRWRTPVAWPATKWCSSTCATPWPAFHGRCWSCADSSASSSRPAPASASPSASRRSSSRSGAAKVAGSSKPAASISG